MKFPYFRWFPADATVDDDYRRFTVEEKGLFHVCLNHGWLSDGLPGDLDELPEFLGVSRTTFSRCWRNVSKKWVLVEGRLRNKRQEEERQKVIKKSESNSKAANSTKRMLSIRSSNAKRMLSECSANGSQRAYGSNSDSGLGVQGEGVEDVVGRIIALHPNKAYPDYASHAFVEIVETAEDPVAEARKIEAAHKLWIRYWSDHYDDDRFVPKLHEFLRGGTWKNTPPNGNRSSSQPHPAFIRSAL